MLETIVSLELPVDERLEIKKQRIMPLSPVNDKTKRISIVTGIHGDELEGQYVIFMLAKHIKENMQNLNAIVDIYPALNPMGIDSIIRGVPAFDLDMNRVFPGNENGSMTEYIAAKIVADIKGSDVCFDLHASNMFLTEIPQIRISEETADTLVPLALHANVDLIWVHSAATVLESTFAHSLNSLKTPTLVVEAGVGMRITQAYGRQTVEGILNLMSKLDMWSGEVNATHTPIISDNPDDVCFLNARASGIFIPSVAHGAHLKLGDKIGEIVNPLTTEVLSTVTSPADGLLFTIREYPVVNEGALIGRVLKGV